MNLAPLASPCVVLTSIRQPTAQVRAFLSQSNWRTIFVADLKTPQFDPPAGLELISVRQQQADPSRFAQLLPWRHYARKNLGYLQAIRSGAELIFDTDDDNAPLEPWTPRPRSTPIVEAAHAKWVNAYAHFGGGHVWPRGYPLEEIGACSRPSTTAASDEDVVVWQGLVEGDPDVDAIFRLTARPEPVVFHTAPPLVLAAGSYCPFNSQNTWWSRPAFPYLYLPSTVTFRFTDILRGFVAQRCLWAHGWRLGFQQVTARQERNEHDLLADFRDELPCYLHPAQIVKKLDGLELSADSETNLRECYAALAQEGWVQPKELELVDGWLTSLHRIATPALALAQ